MEIKHKEGSYKVLIKKGLFEEAGTVFKELTGSSRLFLISDSNVSSLYLDSFTSKIESSGFKLTSFIFEAGEKSKNVETLLKIYDFLLENGISRDVPLVALGGGVVGDIAGFAASTILRGVPFFQVPTTLVSFVDSSVGGKTGINHDAGKNLIGTFYQPKVVLIDPVFLNTLPEREIKAGFAEVLKYGIISNPEIYYLIEEHDGKVTDERDLLTLIEKSVYCKKMVVEEDEKEKGFRRILNFGHTFGHAIEAASNYRQFLHGEAVALGISIASDISKQLGFCDNDTVKKVKRALESLGLPFDYSSIDADEIRKHIGFDKKVEEEAVNFVFLEKIGKVVIKKVAIDELIENFNAALTELKNEKIRKNVIETETLAELYIKQGHKEKGLEIYRGLLTKDPENQSYIEKIAELEKEEKYIFDAEKTIFKLQSFLDKIIRGVAK